MKSLHKIYKNNGIILFPLFLLFLYSSSWLFYYGKGDFVLSMNEIRTDFFDMLFLFATQLGEPLFIVVICSVLLCYDWKKGLFLSLSLIVNTVVVQTLKRLVFSNYKRPGFALSKVIGVKYGDDYQVIEGMRLSVEHSFPSGHTMAGATLFFVLALLTDNKILKIVLFGCVVLVAISRVYLAQHYFMDVFTGGFLAIVLVIFYYVLYNRTKLSFL